ncbi:MAG: hypothetical protein ACRD36_03570, partial [Candidatus Acidiferrum sp.]
MNNRLRVLFTAVLSAAFLIAAPFSGAASGKPAAKPQTEPKTHQQLMKEVRHQLVLLPYYSVFD